MAEIEIQAAHEHEHSADGFAKAVSVMVAVIGIVLAIVTITSHRAHTAAVIERTKANDQWSFYEAKKMREHLMEVGAGLAGVMTSTDPAKAQTLAAQFTKSSQRYAKDAEDVQNEARGFEDASAREEDRALRLDLGEGFLELAMVLSSLYFLSKRRFFPALGGAAAAIGVAVSATSWLL
ncbi:MAG TPA: DUF4337 domain-containing protein [Steroidobacteraceae bacterium]|nr:DUF4337 domain-containing protein [Steroidobacteraceae bacterium]